MSRSIKKTPRAGCSDTEGRRKRLVNRSLRRKQRAYIQQERYDDIPLSVNDVSERRNGPKDGKFRQIFRLSKSKNRRNNLYNQIRNNIINRRSNVAIYWEYIINEDCSRRDINDYKENMRPRCIKACGK